ncbi:alpha/beta hydrolase [Bernardetia sp.]|uniref:alpha/beta hydrolase n=1 Tax=Bernardetia sp. TaxID=1937974 RepID=UPI0025C5A761|nr:dienelactone hydrolase family protein [Bernardetia sp.]
MIKKNISFSYKARYSTHGNLSSTTEYIWVVFHGYGQLAEFFIKKFETLDTDKHYIIAPQGLSTAYLEKFTGRVGANWMTKHERELDIENNLNYLETLVRSELKDISTHAKKIIVLGFSQGAATASRWIAHTDYEINRFLVWGGMIAHDIEPIFYQKMKNKIALFYGDKDEFINEEKLKTGLEVLKEVEISPQLIPYRGTHKIYEEVLNDFIQNSLA